MITVPVRVGQARLAAWTETLVPGTLTGEGSGQRTLTAWFLKHDWHFWWTYDLKRSPLSMAFEGSKIRVGARLSGDLTARWDTLPGEVRSEVEADVGVESSLTLGSDWRLRSVSSVFLAVRRADVPVGITWDGVFFGETISIAGPVRTALAPSLAGLSLEIDTRIEAWDLKPLVETAWQDLQEPRLIAGSPALWFRLAPRSLAAGPVKAGGDAVEVPLTLTVSPSITSGPRPTVPVRPLPVLSGSGADRPGFVLNLPVSIDWEDAVALTSDQWQKNTPWDMGGGAKIRITGLKAATDADRVVLRVDAVVSPPWPGPEVSAVLWVGALPVWDGANRTLRLTQTSLEVRTRDFLAASASWLLGGLWLTRLETALTWDLGPRLDDLRNRAARGLDGLELGDHLVLSARLDGLEVVDSALTDKGIEVLSRITGTAAVTWQP